MKNIESIQNLIIICIVVIAFLTALKGNIGLLLIYAFIIFAIVKRKQSKQKKNDETFQRPKKLEVKLGRQNKHKKEAEKRIIERLTRRNGFYIQKAYKENLERNFKEQKSEEKDSIYYVHCTGICSNCRRDECVEDKWRRGK